MPTLKDNTVDGRLSGRQRLAEHRSNRTCAGCHNLIDPVGLSLEKFDAVGRRRQVEDGVPVDASGGLPDGNRFDDVNGLEAALLRRPELLAGAFAEKLLTYATGRGVEYYDAPAIRTIVRKAQSQDFRISSILLGLESSSARAGTLARQEIIHGRRISPDEVIEKLRKTTVDELQEVARTYFKSETVALGALGNLNGFKVDRSRLAI